MSDQQELDTVVKIADIKDKKDSETKRDEKNEGAITLSTGVVLKPKQVPPMTYLHVMNRFQAPEVPTVLSEQTGRQMENPDDPSYGKAVERWQLQVSDVMMNVFILYGTELVSVPKGFSRPTDEEWMMKLRIVGAEVNPDSENWRYLAWVKTEAAPENEDVEAIMSASGRLTGVAEEDVQSAVDSFPRNEG